MELLLLESFNWNLCLPTPAHYIDYYLFASVNESDLHNGWPITSVTKVRTFMEKYTHYFLEISLQGQLIQALKEGKSQSAIEHCCFVLAILQDDCLLWKMSCALKIPLRGVFHLEMAYYQECSLRSWEKKCKISRNFEIMRKKKIYFPPGFF